MAGRIKGVTVEIGGDVTKLDAALKNVNNEIKDTQSQLKDVERLLKLDPTNTTLLNQKQQLLNETIAATAQKLETLKEAERQAQEQFQHGDITQEQYMGLQREIIATEQSLDKLRDAAEKNGTALYNALNNISDAAKDSRTALEKVGETAQKVGDAAGIVAQKTKGLSNAAAAGVAGLTGLAVSAGLAADDLNTLAKQSGFGTDEIQKWQYAADRVDVSVDDIVGAAKKLKKNMVSTSSDVTAAWDQLGVSVTDSNGELRDSTEVFYEVLAALSQVENETERDILAMQLFGKSADSLAGIVDDGGAALRELGAEAEAAGLILSQDALDGANAFNDGLDTIKAKAAAAAMSAGGALAENLLPMLDTLVGKMSGVLGWVAQLDGGQLQLLATILLVVAAISPVASIIQGISGAVTTLTAIIPAITGGFALFTGAATTGSAAATAFAGALTFITGPVGIVIAAIAGIIAILVVLWNNCEGFRDAVTAAWEFIKEAFQGFIDWLQATFAPVWETIVGTAQTVFQTFQDALAAAWDAITSVFQIFTDFLQDVFGVTWGDTLTGAQGVMETVGGVIQTVVGVLTNIFGGLVSFLADVFLSRFKATLDNLVAHFTAIKDNIVQVVNGIKAIFQGIIDFVTGVFTGDWEKAWQGVKEIFSGVFDTLAGIAKAPINGVIACLNGAISGINSVIQALNKLSFTIPDWVPGLGGKSFGFNLPKIGNIAYLWKGGILESGNAVVGERGPELLSLINGKARVTPLTNNGGGQSIAASAAGIGSYNQTLNFYTASMTPSEVARQTRNAARQVVAKARG